MLRTHSYYMDNTAVCLREQLEEAKKALSNTKKGEVADARSDLADVRRDRLQFWKDTFVEPMKSESEGQSMDFFIKWGHRFQAPTKTQIQAVLDTLDVSLGNWESTNPEAFFGMVQANFSDLVRR